MWERERERERERWRTVIIDTILGHIFESQSGIAWVYIISSNLHHIFLMHIEIHISEPFFFFVLLNLGANTPAAGTLDNTSCQLGWPLLSRILWLFLLLYNFLNAHTFSFQFSIHVIHFHCPFFTQVQYPVLKS